MGTKAKAINLTSPVAFNYDGESRGNAGPRWTAWLREVELYMDASNIDHKPQKKAILLHFVGEQALEIYYAAAQANDEYEDLKTLLNAHFIPQVNVEFEIFKFGELKQKEGENLDDFVVRLRTQAKWCNFGNAAAVTTELKQQVIRGSRCVKLRQKILEAQNPLSLEEILSKARIEDSASLRLKAIERSSS